MSIQSIEARVEKAKRIPLPEWLNPVPLPTILNRDIPALLAVAKAAREVLRASRSDRLCDCERVFHASGAHYDEEDGGSCGFQIVEEHSSRCVFYALDAALAELESME